MGHPVIHHRPHARAIQVEEKLDDESDYCFVIVIIQGLWEVFSFLSVSCYPGRFYEFTQIKLKKHIKD